MLIRSLF